jgi:hypothetical protein
MKRFEVVADVTFYFSVMAESEEQADQLLTQKLIGEDFSYDQAEGARFCLRYQPVVENVFVLKELPLNSENPRAND